ncbi:MAG: prenyltransferase/squalene oxidase repeat-containing protein [Tepidisphaerales bacterium]
MMRMMMRWMVVGACGLGLMPHSPAMAAGADVRRVGVAELGPDADAAITRGLNYIAARQNEDGSWGDKYRAAETSLALMAFMVKGHFPGQGTYGSKLDKAVAFLLRRGQEGAGYFGTKQQGMYEHGLATLALSEVWGESDRDEIKEALKKAVKVILGAQNPEGGWRYGTAPQDADMSVTVMQLVALTSAKEAGIHVPDEVFNKAIAYVLACQHPLGGFAYQPRQEPGFARTAAGVLSLCMTGQRNSVAMQAGVNYLIKQPDTKFANTEYYFYAHYYAIQSMYQSGEANYQAWYPKIRDALLSKQRPDGCWQNSEGGTTSVYSTSMAVLILGVPYRFLPIYQR